MTCHVARYAVSFGLSGCYLPDSQSGPYEFRTRSEMAEFLRNEIASMEWPASLFSRIKLRRRWTLIARYGSSVQHLSIVHNGYELYLHGLTDAEFDAMASEEN